MKHESGGEMMKARNTIQNFRLISNTDTSKCYIIFYLYVIWYVLNIK